MNEPHPTDFAASVQAVIDSLKQAVSGDSLPFDLKKWVDGALLISAGKSARNRALPPADVVWLTVGMAIYRSASIRDVSVVLGLKGDGGTSAASSSLVEARKRLGTAAMRHLFESLTVEWSCPAVDQDTWQGLGVYAMDGTTLAVPDTDENF